MWGKNVKVGSHTVELYAFTLPTLLRAMPSCGGRGGVTFQWLLKPLTLHLDPIDGRQWVTLLEYGNYCDATTFWARVPWRVMHSEPCPPFSCPHPQTTCFSTPYILQTLPQRVGSEAWVSCVLQLGSLSNKHALLKDSALPCVGTQISGELTMAWVHWDGARGD